MFHEQLCGLENERLTECAPGLCSWLCQTGRDGSEVHPSGVGKLSTEVYRWLEYFTNLIGRHWRRFIDSTARDRLKSAKRLVWDHWQPSQARTRQRLHILRHYFHGAALYTLQRKQGRGRRDGLGKASFSHE